jgi:hypothetical protein
MMMLRKDPLRVDNRLPPRQGVETKEKAKEGEVAAPLALRAVVILPVGKQSTVEGLVDPLKGQDQGALLTRSVGSTLASEVTRELKEALVRDTLKENAIPGDVLGNTRDLVSFISMKDTALRGITAIMPMFRSPRSREGTNLRGNTLLIRNKLPILEPNRVVNVVTHHIKERVEKGMWLLCFLPMLTS